MRERRREGRLGAHLAVGALILVASQVFPACGRHTDQGRVDPVYDPATGRLQQLKYDSDKDGKIDTVSHMDGARVLRIDIDSDEDGRVERWEYYRADQTVEKVGFSRASDGVEDAWSFAGSDGSVVRVEISMRRDGKVTRVEHYERSELAAAEEDSDGDGRMDRWERYQGERLVSVAFDTAHRGSADRRFLYGNDGSARLEIDPDGDGHFELVKK
jgi:hypothetical protein